MSTKVQKNQKDIAEIVLTRVNKLQDAGGLNIPKDYSTENALKGAWLYLQSAIDKNKKPVLEVCDETSIATALFEMVTEGLSAVKNQCYFIAYAGKLGYQKSYFGNLALAKRICGIKNVKGAIIYEGDKKGFKYEVDLTTGRKKLISHTPCFDSIDNNKIAGAYAIVINEDGTSDMEIMAMKDVRIAWNQGASKGNRPAHKNFPDQMAIKTVMNRAVKIALASSDDKHLGLEEKASVGQLGSREIETIEIEESKQEPEVITESQEEKPIEEKKEKQTPNF